MENMIQLNGLPYKCHDIIMLHKNSVTEILKTDNGLEYNPFFKNSESDNYQHIYILFDDEIKEGDWYFNKSANHIGKGLKNNEIWHKRFCKKIIATTDTSLKLPLLSQDFVQKYVEECNKGNIISKVWIEYTKGAQCRTLKRDGSTIDEWVAGKLNVNCYNTISNIIILQQKKSWSREEVIEKLFSFDKDTNASVSNFAKKYPNITVKELKNKWIEENLL